MDSFERNKIAGAVLGSVLIGFGLSIFSDILFSSEAPEHPGYVIAVAEPAAAGGGEAPAAAQPIGVLLASAEAGAGEASAKKCAACHTFGSGEANKVGPNLYAIVDRPIASHEGYEYGEAMRAHAAAAKTWSYDNLNAFLLDPKGAVPGTKMAFAGLKNDAERANVIAYLRTLSPSPVPLPPAEAAAEPAPAAEAPAAEAPAAAESPAQAAAEPADSNARPAPAPAEGGAAPPGQPAATGQAADAAAGAGASSAPDQQGGTPQVAPVEQPAPEPGEPAADAAAAAPAVPAEPTAAPSPPAAAPVQPAPAPAQPAPAADPAQGAAAPASPQPGAPAPVQQNAALAPAATGGGDFAALVASSDAALGASVAKRCTVCHSLAKDGPNKIGPHMWGVINRPIGSISDYTYSAAFKAFAAGGSKTWTVAELDPWLLDPKAHVPGTKMAFPGLKKDNERAAVIRYLETLSDTPPAQ